jgi:hypothetical protein
LIAAIGVPRYLPNASPRRVVQFGLVALLLGIVVLMAGLEAGAGPEIITWPMLLAGLGIGALASQLGAVTVSAVADEKTGEVGGLQNTLTNLGASLGTALAGSVLIASLTTAFISGIASNPDVPDAVKTQAPVELSGGVPFVSDADLRDALDAAGASQATTDAIVEENEDARLLALRDAVAVLALFALAALALSRRIPMHQAGRDPAATPTHT